MKALTIWQPWASLIMVGAKPYEFRGRSYLAYVNHPQPGERIVIHAGARKMVVGEIADLLNKLGDPDGDCTGLVREPAYGVLHRIWNQPRCAFQMLPLGAGLGTAIIGKPCNAAMIFGAQIDGLPQDSDRGEFNWAWPLSEIAAFESPIPARGRQGFWQWTAAT